jgi:hypothetical protein
MTILSAFKRGRETAFEAAYTDINGTTRSWGHEEYTHSPIAPGVRYNMNGHVEVISPLNGSPANQDLFLATIPYHTWRIVDGLITIRYAPETDRGSVRVCIFPQSGAGLPPTMNTPVTSCHTFTAAAGTQEVQFRLARQLSRPYENPYNGRSIPVTDDKLYDANTDGPVLTFTVANSSSGASSVVYDIPEGSELGTLTVSYVVESSGRADWRGAALLKIWADAGYPVPGSAPPEDDIPGFYHSTEQLPAIPDSDVTNPGEWPVVPLEYLPTAALGSHRRIIPQLYSPVTWAARPVREKAIQIESMIAASTAGFGGWIPLMGVLAGVDPCAVVMGWDAVARAVLWAYGVRSVDSSAAIASIQSPRGTYQSLKPSWPLADGTVSPIVGGRASIKADLDDATKAPNDGLGHYVRDSVAGLKVGETWAWTGVVIMRSPPDSLTSGYGLAAIGLQAGFSRIVRVTSKGTGLSIVSGFSLGFADVEAVGQEVPASPPVGCARVVDDQYRELPADLQARIAATAGGPRFFGTISGMSVQSNGILTDVIGFIGDHISIHSPPGDKPGKRKPYLRDTTGTSEVAPGALIGVMLAPPRPTQTNVVRGVVAANVTDFPTMALGRKYGLSAEAVVPGSHLCTATVHVTCIVSDVAFSMTPGVRGITLTALGECQIAVSLNNPADDFELWQLTNLPLINPSATATQRTERPPLMRTATASTKLLNVDIKWTPWKGTPQEITARPDAWVSNVRQLEIVGNISVVLPATLPVTREDVDNPGRWHAIEPDTPLYFTAGACVQSVAEFSGQWSDTAEFVYVPGPPAVYGKVDDQGNVTGTSLSTPDVPWLSVTRFDFGVTVGPRPTEE